jgi:hypothetical protein
MKAAFACLILCLIPATASSQLCCDWGVGTCAIGLTEFECAPGVTCCLAVNPGDPDGNIFTACCPGRESCVFKTITLPSGYAGWTTCCTGTPGCF